MESYKPAAPSKRSELLSQPSLPNSRITYQRHDSRHTGCRVIQSEGERA
jgi:hypothetical protein